MKNSESKIIGLTLLLNRVSLGLLFALAGVRKLLPGEEASILDKMHGFASYTAGQAPLPEVLGKAYGYALPWAEIIFGLLLLIGLFTRVAAVLIALMLASFIIAMGAEWWPDSGPAYTNNFILLTLALLIAAAGSGKFAVKPSGPLH